MKRILLFFIFPLLLCGCKKEVSREEMALQSAKAYYDQLLHGDCESFLAGQLHGDTVPEDYREQMLLNVQMYREQQSKEHGGLTEVEALRAKGDTAYLSLHYADSTREEIVVPMMERNNTWYMR